MNFFQPPFKFLYLDIISDSLLTDVSVGMLRGAASRNRRECSCAMPCMCHFRGSDRQSSQALCVGLASGGVCDGGEGSVGVAVMTH